MRRVSQMRKVSSSFTLDADSMQWLDDYCFKSRIARSVILQDMVNRFIEEVEAESKKEEI